MATLQEIIEECRNDLLVFGKTLTPQTFFKDSPSFHYEVADAMMDRTIKQLCIQAPRGFAKSSLAMMFILHHITFDEGDKFVIIQSKTAGEAINRLTKIKEVISIPTYWDLVGTRIYDKISPVWRENKIKINIGDARITIKAIGTGMQVRGALESDSRITLYVLDDPEDELNCKTEEAMASNFRVFLGGLPGLDSRNGRVIVIGTPVHELCIVEKLKQMKSWVFKWYEACDENFENLLWEEYRTAEWLKNEYESLSSVGQRRIFYSEYRCSLIPGEDQLFKPDDFRYYEGEFEIKDGMTFLKIDGQLKPINVFLGIDPASSVQQSADYSVVMPVGFDENKNIYILDYFRKRVNPLALTEAIIDYIKRFKPVRGHIESTGFQEMLRQTVRQRLQDEGLHLSGLELKFNPRTEKSARLETLQPFFAQHRVFLKKEQKELTDELLMYPRGKHDDCIKENALIKTLDGYKEVKNVKVGDLVFTHLGNYKRVKRVIKKDFKGKFCTLKPVGQLPLEISTDHKIYYASRIYCKNGQEEYYPGYENRGWVEAGEFKKTYKNVIPIERLHNNHNYEYCLPGSKGSSNEKLNKLTLDKEFAKILGYFLAEGCAYTGENHGQRFHISFASHTKEYGKRNFVKKYFGKFNISVRESIKGNIAELVFDNKFFHNLFIQCYDDDKEKILPPYMKYLGQDLKYTLIWWMAGDGWTLKRKSIWGKNILKSADRYCGSVSPKLALGMRDIALSCGYYAVIRKLKRHRFGKPTKDFYQIDLRFSKPNFSKITELSLLEKGSSIKVLEIADYEGDVYDLQVAEDYSFICNGFAIHNCIDGLYYATRKLIVPDYTTEEKEYGDDLRLILSRGDKPKELGWRAA